MNKLRAGVVGLLFLLTAIFPAISRLPLDDGAGMVMFFLVWYGVLFILLTLWIAFEFPTFRMALGIVQFVAGLLLSITIIGLPVGVPLLLIGSAFTISGYYSKEKELRQLEPKSKVAETAADQLKKLKELSDMGAITKAEYKKKKKALLERI